MMTKSSAHIALPASPGGSLERIVAEARRCLARSHVVARLRARAWIILGAAAGAAASRPLLWPLREVTPTHAVVRTVLLAGVAALAAVVGLTLHAWRSRPSMLGAARRLDTALGLPEVIASGFAFERDLRSDEATAVAIGRARRATEGIVLSAALAAKPAARTARERRWLQGASVALVLGLTVGAVDRLAIQNLLRPVTRRELADAAELRRAAEIAAQGDKEAITPAMLEAAQRASTAAERGDREAARRALEDLRRATHDRDSAEREQARALRALRDQLASTGSGQSDPAGEERPATSATDALARTRRELEAAKDEPEAVKKLAERLARAEAAARSASQAAAAPRPPGAGRSRTAEEASAWSKAAKALEEAREAAARGDAAAAKAALERAEAAIKELEKKRDPSAARARAKLGDGAASLDRSLAAGEKQRGGAEGEGEGEGQGEGGKGAGEDGKDGSGPNAANGAKADGAPAPGGGRAPGDRSAGAERGRLKMNGSLQARTDAREGERAASTIQGMGKGGDPKAYGQVFPAYDTAVEDGLREDLVPAARRPNVRRYFHSIRPGSEPAPSAPNERESEN